MSFRGVLALAVILMAMSATTSAEPQNGTPPAATQNATQAAETTAVADLESDQLKPTAVTLEGEPLLWVTVPIGPYSPQNRADRIGQRLLEAVHDRALRDPSVMVVEAEGSSEIRAGSHLLMLVTPRDAASIGAPRTSLAQQYARILETAIRNERLRYAPATLIRSGVFGLIATLAFALVVWGIQRLSGRLRAALASRLASKADTLAVIPSEMLSANRLSQGLATAALIVRLGLFLLALDFYLTYTLGLFPWTRVISFKLVGYAFAPVRWVMIAVTGYLPKLLFVLVITAAIHVGIRLVNAFFRQIEDGRVAFDNFPPEWASPTNKIARVLLIAFGLVVSFPYLPASDSPAFAGVSVFIGVLVSLSSSSALSNIIAGLVLTYSGAFKPGDRVRVGDAVGDVIGTSLLATRLRTIKHEHVTIPNSIALSTTVTNYSREAKTHGLILHTSVTIGYDAPWRRIHDLLTQAALGTPGVLADPRPFVWQTALNDFYVTYEINAYTAVPNDMADIYAALHSRIQDAFYAAGVEIMSPHYTSIRDGSTIAIPEALRSPGYQAPPFRVADATPIPQGRPPRGA
ncbi:MAG TPA: mechanosensitive ion channel domain-containing protein [Vicinamibacterales bacterium]|jgi:small-conductance mechanosensitive channel